MCLLLLWLLLWLRQAGGQCWSNSSHRRRCRHRRRNRQRHGRQAQSRPQPPTSRRPRHRHRQLGYLQLQCHSRRHRRRRSFVPSNTNGRNNSLLLILLLSRRQTLRLHLRPRPSPALGRHRHRQHRHVHHSLRPSFGHGIRQFRPRRRPGNHGTPTLLELRILSIFPDVHTHLRFFSLFFPAPKPRCLRIPPLVGESEMGVDACIPAMRLRISS